MARLLETFGTRLRTAGANRLFQVVPQFAGAGNAIALANFVFEGTGQAANTIALFGHAFPRGAIAPDDPVLLRRQATDDFLRTQMNVLSVWPDNSVKTALLAAELPALADGVKLTTVLRVGETHPDPGADLNLATLLSGRSVAIKTWAPGNTTTPLWTYDPLAAIGADRWHQGPLAVSTRVETPVPSSGVQNTSGTAGVVQSVRLVVDIIATKDGFLEVDAAFQNDRLPFPETAGSYPTAAIARFGYTIEIDGVMVYDQRPASGAGRDLLLWSRWVRRRGRKLDGTLLSGIGASNRAFVRPDFDLLVRSGVQLPYDQSVDLATTDILGHIDYHLGNNVGQETNPYAAWGLLRAAGEPGGRNEIGYRTLANAVWMTHGYRGAQILAMRQFEASATMPKHYALWPADNPSIAQARWATVLDCPKALLLGPHPGGQATLGQSRLEMGGLPSSLWPSHNATDHIGMNRSHYGSFNWTPALLTGRRHCYDGLAARATWNTVGREARFNGDWGPFYTGSPPFSNFEPNEETGVAWGPIPHNGQIRTGGWDLRDVVDAAAILPDSYPNRTFYTRNANALFNAWKTVLPATYAHWGNSDIAAPVTGGTHNTNFQMSFWFYGCVTAARMGIGGTTPTDLLRAMTQFRTNGMLTPEVNYLNLVMSIDILVRTLGTNIPFQSWAEIQGYHVAQGVDVNFTTQGPGEFDWQRNALGGMVLAAYLVDAPLEEKARTRDALVMWRSTRAYQWGRDYHPRYQPEVFFGAFTYQSNAITAPGITYQWNTAPTIPAGQVLTVPLDAPDGAVVGLVETQGPLPRNSAEGRGVNDAFVIVSQPAGNPFSISQGGAIRVASASTLAGMALGDYTVQVYCRTYSQYLQTDPNTEHRSATVPVTVHVTAEQPAIAPAGPFTVGNNAQVGAFVGQLEITGTQPITMSIIAGDPGGRFAVDNAGRVTVAADLSSIAPELRTLTFRATGPGGAAERQVQIQITTAVFPPVIQAGQTVTVEEGLPAGTYVQPDLVIGGTPPTQLQILSGDPNGRFETVLPNRIRTKAVLSRTQATGYTLGVRAVNSAGEDTRSVTANVAPASWIWQTSADTVYLGAYDLSRRLRTHHTGALFRARRLADSAEQDFGTSGTVSASDIQTFANGGLVELVALYDQGLTGNHLTSAGPNGYPRLTDASGTAYAINSRPVMHLEGNRGIAHTAFATTAATDLAAFVIAHHLTFEGDQNQPRIIAFSPFLNGDDNAGSATLRFAVNTNEQQLFARRNGNLALTGNNVFPPNQTRLASVISGTQAGWGLRVQVGTGTMSGANTIAHPAMQTTGHLRIGHFSSAWPGHRWIGRIGRIVITAAIDKATVFPAIRSSAMTDYGLS